MVRRNKVPAKPTKAAVARLGALAVEAGALLALSLVLAACDSPTDSDDDDWYYSPTYYDITFSVGEGSGTPPASERTSTFYPPGQGNMTAPEGKYFMGWSSSSGGSIDYLPGRVYHISGDKTLTAQWGPGYTITFSAGTGSGTPPASQTAAAGEVINLPGQGDMTASDDNYSYLFNGWKLSSGGTPSETTYRDRDEYTVTGDCTFTAYWMTGFHLYTFTFSTGEGSGTPPPSQKTSESITLPGQGDMTAPAGKYFSGWKSDRDYSTIYEAGSTYTASGYYYSYEVTLTAQWSSKGVYVGIHSFAGGVTNIWDGYTDTRISNLSYLNSTGRSSLISGLNNYYKRGSASGTALYYAVHRALANLKEAESRFETASIQSVNLITFTDGLDNASFGASNNSPIEDKSGVTSVDYAAYIKEQIGSRTIGGKPITAYSIGVKGSDVTDTAAFDTTLSNIASAGNTHTLTDFSGLEAKLKEIADGIEISSEINFTMQTTQNDPGTVIRMTFDITSTTPSDAASSTRYIEGTLAYDSAAQTWSLTNITYSTGISSESGAVIAGTASGSNVSFIFRNLSGYDPKTDTAKQWIKASTSSSWQINSEYNASGSTDTTAETMLVYLVLDASTSLQDSQITQIRTAVNSFIDTLYNRVHATE